MSAKSFMMDPQDVRDAHKANPDGRCRECGEIKPCTAVQMADQVSCLHADLAGVRDHFVRVRNGLAGQVLEARAELAAAQAQLDKVADLHQEDPASPYTGGSCLVDGEYWPCRTAQAVGGES